MVSVNVAQIRYRLPCYINVSAASIFFRIVTFFARLFRRRTHYQRYARMKKKSYPSYI